MGEDDKRLLDAMREYFLAAMSVRGSSASEVPFRIFVDLRKMAVARKILTDEVLSPKMKDADIKTLPPPLEELASNPAQKWPT